MSDDIEVPMEIIQKGLMRCYAPHDVQGWMSAGSRESYSEVRKFEYRVMPETFVMAREVFPANGTEELSFAY